MGEHGMAWHGLHHVCMYRFLKGCCERGGYLTACIVEVCWY